MAYGFIKSIAPFQHTELAFSGTGGGTEYPSLKILNPNDGVVYVARNRDALSANLGDWEWKVPSQSYAALPGPFTSVGMFYLDQSGAGRQGEITVYPSNSKLDDPLFIAIGRALQAIGSTLDITESTTPANPGAGVLRLWANSADESLNELLSNGVARRIWTTADSVALTYAKTNFSQTYPLPATQADFGNGITLVQNGIYIVSWYALLSFTSVANIDIGLRISAPGSQFVLGGNLTPPSATAYAMVSASGVVVAGGTSCFMAGFGSNASVVPTDPSTGASSTLISAVRIG